MQKILGIPACGMFSKITGLDLVLPRLLTGEKVSAQKVAALGQGGLCQNGPEGSRYPRYPFSK